MYLGEVELTGQVIPYIPQRSFLEGNGVAHTLPSFVIKKDMTTRGARTVRSEMICGPGGPRILPHTGTMGFAHATQLTARFHATPHRFTNGRSCSRVWHGQQGVMRGGCSDYSAFRGVGVGNILAVPLYWGGGREAMA